MAVRDVYPLEADKPELPANLAALERLALTTVESPEPDLGYLFKHVITQEVAYRMMAPAQRRALHQAVAEWYERRHEADLSPFFPLLASNEISLLRSVMDRFKAPKFYPASSTPARECHRLVREVLSVPV